MTGKEKCALLKAIRIEVAKENGIDFSTVQCKQEAECIGTCPRCVVEEKYIEAEIDKIINNGGIVKIPETFYEHYMQGADLFSEKKDIEKILSISEDMINETPMDLMGDAILENFDFIEIEEKNKGNLEDEW